MGTFSRTMCCAVFLLIMGACTSSARSQVHDIVDRLEDAGLSCTDLVIEQPLSTGESRPASAPPVPTATGFCHLEEGKRDVEDHLSSIYIFPGGEHDRHAEERGGFPGVSIVYGDNYEMQVVPSEQGPAVRDALGGALIPPLAPESQTQRVVSGTLTSITVSKVCVRGPGCYDLSSDSRVEEGLRPGDDVDVGVLARRVAEYVRSP